MYVTLHFRMDEETKKIIETLSSHFACSKGELTRRALKFFNQIYSEGRRGNDVVIRYNKENKEKFILIA